MDQLHHCWKLLLRDTVIFGKQLLLSNADGCSKDQKKLSPIVPLAFFSFLTSLFALISSDILILGVAALIAAHTFFMKNRYSKQGRPLTPLCYKQPVAHTRVALAPGFQSAKLDEQLEELMTKITPAPEDVQAVDSLASFLQQVITKELSIEATVTGFSYSNPFIDSPLAKIEPEISISVDVDLAKYHICNQDKQSNQQGCTMESAPKNIIRRIKKCLVSKHDFKLRRFVFTESPRLMLNAPVQRDNVKNRACMQIAVNSNLPMHGAKVMAFCNKFQPIACELVLLVQQWTRWRALCLTDNGDLHPYVWTLLVTFYMQSEACSHVLPPFEECPPNTAKCTNLDSIQHSLGDLLKGFFRFYHQDFDFSTEVVSVSKGKRGKREGNSHTWLCIEDPLETQQDLTSTVTQQRFELLQQELQRADSLCSSGAMLPVLFQFPDELYR